MSSDLKKKKKLQGGGHLELKPLFIANWITHPIGCIAIFLLTIAYMGVLLYITVNPLTLCLSFNFRDFKVIGSAISDNWYQYDISKSENGFDNVYYCNCSSASASANGRRRLGRRRGRRRRRSLIETYVWDDYYTRAVSSVYLEVFYFALGSSDLLSAEHMSEAHAIAQGVKSWDGYESHALLYDSTYRDPITNDRIFLQALTGSFLNFLYPTVLTIPGTSLNGVSYYDGNGDNDDLTTAEVKELARDIVSAYSEYSFFDFKFDLVDAESKWMIDIYPFGYKDISESQTELLEWIKTYNNYFNSVKKDKIGIAFADSKGAILTDQLFEYLYDDLRKASISGVLIFIVVYFYTRSLLIAIFGLLGIALSFIPAFVLFEAIYGSNFNIIV